MISAFLVSGKSDGIPADVQLFLKQLQWAAEIYEYERNITRAAKLLKQRINALQHLNLDERTCKARIYAAINYFSIDNNVSIKVWESNYADKYEDLAKLSAVRGDYKTQKQCYDAAAECRRRASEIAEADRDLGVVFLISPDITPEELGYSKKSLKEIAKMVGLSIPLTLYVARHSWASIAKSKNIPISVISEGMGHDSEMTTQIYLASLDYAVVDRANAQILKDL